MFDIFILDFRISWHIDFNYLLFDHFLIYGYSLIFTHTRPTIFVAIWNKLNHWKLAITTKEMSITSQYKNNIMLLSLWHPFWAYTCPRCMWITPSDYNIYLDDDDDERGGQSAGYQVVSEICRVSYDEKRTGVYSLQYSPDAKLLAVGYGDGSIQVR